MTKEVKVETARTTRKPVAPELSSGELGRSLAEALHVLEARDPASAARTGLTSAGMRAGAIVRGMRRSAGLAQADLALRLGVSQERVSEIERGAGPQGPTFELLERIAAACGMKLVATLVEPAEEVAAEIAYPSIEA